MFCCGWWLMFQWLFFHRCPLCHVTFGRMIESQEQDVRSLSYSFQFVCVMCNDRSEYCTKAKRSFRYLDSRLQNSWFDTRGFCVDNNGPQDCPFKGIQCHKCLIFVYFGLENVSTFFLKGVHCCESSGSSHSKRRVVELICGLQNFPSCEYFCFKDF